MERLNDSIRTYVYCVLGAQSQTKTDILGSSTSFDVQKQLLAILEDIVHSPVDLPSSVQRYQEVLKYARSKLDFVVGIGMYMIPSDLRLQTGIVVDYNNKILIATESQFERNAALSPSLALMMTLTTVPLQQEFLPLHCIQS